ncbi:hypothetical protein LUZ60_009834 [Juncus effusus]|nr:hypothetical protein LUZ60_009834 [Juncus effusus]
MALANKRTSKETKSNSFYTDSPLDLFSYKDMQQPLLLEEEEESVSESLRAYYTGFAPTQFDSSNSPYGNLICGASGSMMQETQSWMGSKSGALDQWAYSNSSVLSFDRDDECATWIDAVDQNFALNVNNSSSTDNIREVVEAQDKASQKRTNTGVGVQSSKKQCTSKKAKAKPTSAKDPQSAAAKVRRERISERLKVLQELVPNGTKVDLVTMLEKAISYVKFLQLQVKVLATDEFWPTQGGKAPNLSQVKDAIDAILCSQRNKNSKE